MLSRYVRMLQDHVWFLLIFSVGIAWNIRSISECSVQYKLNRVTWTKKCKVVTFVAPIGTVSFHEYDYCWKLSSDYCFLMYLMTYSFNLFYVALGGRECWIVEDLEGSGCGWVYGRVPTLTRREWGKPYNPRSGCLMSEHWQFVLNVLLIKLSGEPYSCSAQ